MIRLLAVTLGALVLFAPARARAVAADVRTLVIEGRVADAEGFPVAKAHIDAGARATVDVDENGRYLVSLVIGSVPGLTRTPFHVALAPWKRGWRIGLPGSQAPLVIDVRLGTGPDRRPRLEVRSNDRWVAQALADSIAAGGTPLHLTVHFLGAPGTGAAPPPGPDVAAIVPLHELEWPARGSVPLAAAAPQGASAVPLPNQAPNAGAAAPPSEAVAAASGDARPSGNPATGFATRTPANSGADTRGGNAGGARGRAGTSSTGTGSAGGGSASRSYHLFPSADEALSAAPRESTRAPRPAPDTTATRIAARPTPSPRPAPPARALPPDAPAAPTAPTDRGANPAPQHPALAQHPTPAQHPAATEHSAPTEHPGPAVPNPAVSIHVIGGDPLEHSNAVRVWGGRVVPTSDTPGPGAADCGCIVQGTVEVRTDRPLGERVRVVVALEEHPALCDTAELFMGAPRPFVLRGVPCGQHRLDVRVLSKRRYRVANPEALGTFDCSSGALHHPRVALVPR
jgi:hypothetical protein